MGGGRYENGIEGLRGPQREGSRVFHIDLFSFLVMGIKSKEKTQQVLCYRTGAETGRLLPRLAWPEFEENSFWG